MRMTHGPFDSRSTRKHIKSTVEVSLYLHTSPIIERVLVSTVHRFDPNLGRDRGHGVRSERVVQE